MTCGCCAGTCELCDPSLDPRRETLRNQTPGVDPGAMDDTRRGGALAGQATRLTDYPNEAGDEAPPTIS